MFELEKITVKDLWSLEDESLFSSYLDLKEVLKPVPVFCGYEARELGALEFGQVANLKEFISAPSFDGILEAFEIVFKVNKKTYLAADVVSYFHALNWITAEVEKIVNREIKLLAADPDPVMEMAGAKALDIFKELPILRDLGRQYGQPPQIVETWKYNLVFSLLLLDKKEAEVRRNYNQLKKMNK